MSDEWKRRVRKGMTVKLAGGKTLGRVIEVEGSSFVAHGLGITDRVDYVADFDQIAELRGDEIILAQKATAKDAPKQSARAKPAAEEADVTDGARRVALAEEKVDVQKHVHAAGEVRLNKRVVTEMKTFTVPVMHEELHIERVPVSADTPIPAEAASFTESTIRVPLMCEEVEIVKRAVVREEVLVRKDRVVTEQRVAADVRHEELDVEDVSRATPSRNRGGGGWRGPGGSEGL